MKMVFNHIIIDIVNKPNQGRVCLPPSSMAEYFPGYGDGDTRPRPRVCSSRSSMAWCFTGTDTSIYSSILVILWTACVKRPRKFP